MAGGPSRISGILKPYLNRVKMAVFAFLLRWRIFTRVKGKSPFKGL